jgi:hypothetical protein
MVGVAEEKEKCGRRIRGLSHVVKNGKAFCAARVSKA